MIKSIIFDFAGVVGSDGYWIWLKEKLPDLEKRKKYFQDISVQVDDGTITNQEFVWLISKEIHEQSIIVWEEIYKRIIINQKLLEIILKLKEQYKICLLTNFTNEWISELIEIYNLDQYFDVKVISSVEKLVKPNKKIYQIALERLLLKPEEAIFIDDRQKNVDGGENAGIKSILFTTNEQLIKDFKKLGMEI